MESLHTNIQLILKFLSSILGPTRFLLYFSFICEIAVYADDTTLYSKCVRHLICGNNLNWLLNLNLIYKGLWTGVRSSSLSISILENLNWFHLTGLITMILLM